MKQIKKLNSIQLKSLKLKNYTAKVKSFAFAEPAILSTVDVPTFTSIVPKNFTPQGVKNNGVSDKLIFNNTHPSWGAGTNKPTPAPAHPSNMHASWRAGVAWRDAGGVILMISNKIHKHIKSIYTFNSELAHSHNIEFKFNNQNNASWRKFKFTSLLENSFLNMGAVISDLVIKSNANKVMINLFYYSPKINIMSNFRLGKELISNSYNIKPVNLQDESINLKNLCTFLSKKLKKSVELDIIRLHHPSLDSKILANTIGYIAENKKVRFRPMILKLIKYTKIIRFNESSIQTLPAGGVSDTNIAKYCNPTAILGMKIKLGGRIFSQKVVPRFTSITKQKGAFARTKSDFSTKSRFTNKSRRGAFSFTVTMSHKI